MNFTLDQLPAILEELLTSAREVQVLRQEVQELRARLPQWVTDEEAQQLTGLSRDTLRRHRLAAGSLLIWKDDHGLRYDRDSLLRHNEARAQGRSRLARLLTPAA